MIRPLDSPCRLNPSSPAGFTELVLRGRIDRARTCNDRGASVVEWVIISALAVTIAVVVGGVLMVKLRDKAGSINLDQQPGGAGGGNGGGGGGVP